MEEKGGGHINFPPLKRVGGGLKRGFTVSIKGNKTYIVKYLIICSERQLDNIIQLKALDFISIFYCRQPSVLEHFPKWSE